MEQVEKELKLVKWTNESFIEILMNSNNKERLNEILPIIRRYTSAIVVHYKMDLESAARVSIGTKVFAVA
ncbi:hypothetical protein [Cytophaga aurantiaca]|uniref:hypothetical protein n=1 Tax=Cytophaga aurantiaca TaxID=29530 RepID=UPI00035F6BC4|nr:hypothetical protein [Cytophaga aurantiaca]